MDKRNWLRRRRSSEVFVPTESVESSLADSSVQLYDEDMAKTVSDHMEHADVTIDITQRSEGKAKHLNERLSTSWMHNSGRDDVIKQHTKVAEEAVSGWEKAEAEALKLKQHLEVVLQQKLAAEDRVSHLDGALKECMHQLRFTREEREQKIHEVIVKKTREWDTLHCELEEKLEDVGQQLLEAETEKNMMCKTLQERGQVTSDLNNALSKAEAEVKLLQVQLDSVEKQNSAFKHELHALNREMKIQNEEIERSKRGADAANKQHTEDIKKISKLEAECQHLRMLVSKKLPGPVALSQLNLEVEKSRKEKAEGNRKRPVGKSSGSPMSMLVESVEDSVHAPGLKESEAMLKHMLAMEKEIKGLKDSLARKNNELQDARLLCSQTAAKLSIAEEQFYALSNSHGHPKAAGMTYLDMQSEVSRSLCLSKEPSLASASDGNDGDPSCAESWASALIAELAQFKQEKSVTSPVLTADSITIDLMDDFIEMERLASMSPSKIDTTGHEINRPKESINELLRKNEIFDSCNYGKQSTTTSDQFIADREAELQSARDLCKEVSRKLVAAEEQLGSLQSQHAVSQSTLLWLQENIELIFKAEEEGANLEKVVKDVRASLGSSHSIVKLQAHIRRLSKGSCPAEIDIPEGINLPNSEKVPAFNDSSSEDETSSSSDIELNAQMLSSDLNKLVCNLVHVFEDLTVFTCGSHSSFPMTEELFTSPGHSLDLDVSKNVLECTDLEVDTGIQKFIAAGNGFMEGKQDFQRFIVELLSMLERLRRKLTLSVNGSNRREVEWKRSPPEHAKLHEANISETSKSDGSEKGVSLAMSTTEPTAVREEMSSTNAMEEELQKSKAEKAALECQFKDEASRNVELAEELARLKREKVRIEAELEEEKEKLANAKFQLHEAEELAANLHSQLCSAEESKDKVNEQLLNLDAAKTRAELKLESVDAELSELQNHVDVLEKEVHDKCQHIEFLEAKCHDLEQQVQETMLNCPSCADRNEETRFNKELEIAAAAEKLAECQRTILLLSRKLKALASPRESMDLSYDSTEDSAFSVDRSSSGRRREVSEASSSGGRIVEHEKNSFPGPRRKCKQYQGWSCRDISISDVLTGESMKLPPKRLHSLGKATTITLFPEEMSPCSEAVVQTQSSPDARAEFTPRSSMKASTRRKRSPSSMGRIDFSKSLTEAISPAGSFEKHASSFSKLFYRTRNSQ